MRKLIIIPTYNESQNIQRLIEDILRYQIFDLDILIVDDNSPDGTAQIVNKMREKLSNLYLIKRQGKLGLGTAYITGFKWGLVRNYDIFVQMDADFSHDAKYLNTFFAQMDVCDFVIGSRYIKGGGVVNWPLKRKLLSLMGNLYARHILGIKINDFTGGFNVWKKEVLEKINLDSIKSEGYSFQIEMKYRAVKAGFSFIEVPIIFNDRTCGQSKMSKKIFKEAIWRVWWLRFNNLYHQFNKLKPIEKFFTCLIVPWFIFLIIFRFHNALAFNPYWGYDGGAHIDYINSLADKNSFPDIKKNYLAWHEPFYYILMALLVKIYKFFAVEPIEIKSLLNYLSYWQAILSLITTLVMYKLLKLLTSSRVISFFSLMFLSLFPSFTQASSFITNELLNYFFCFYIIYFLVKRFAYQSKVNVCDYIILGVLLGLALLTKITALIMVLIVAFYLLGKVFYHKSLLWLKGFLITMFIAAAIYAPWLIYRHGNILDSFSINNTKMLTPQALKFDKRLQMFTVFDVNIWQKSPYFPSGAPSFWLMLGADTIIDYYGSLENRDLSNLTVDKKSFINISTGETSPVWVTARHFKLNQYLSYAGLVILFILICGAVYNTVNFFKDRRLINYLMFMVAVAFLAAQIYYVYRYPYLDFGVIKSIFIFPMFLPLMVGGLTFLRKIKMHYLIIPAGLVYVAVAIMTFWVDKFNY